MGFSSPSTVTDSTAIPPFPQLSGPRRRILATSCRIKKPSNYRRKIDHTRRGALRGFNRLPQEIRDVIFGHVYTAKNKLDVIEVKFEAIPEYVLRKYYDPRRKPFLDAGYFRYRYRLRSTRETPPEARTTEEEWQEYKRKYNGILRLGTGEPIRYNPERETIYMDRNSLLNLSHYLSRHYHTRPRPISTEENTSRNETNAIGNPKHPPSQLQGFEDIRNLATHYRVERPPRGLKRLLTRLLTGVEKVARKKNVYGAAESSYRSVCRNLQTFFEVNDYISRNKLEWGRNAYEDSKGLADDQWFKWEDRISRFEKRDRHKDDLYNGKSDDETLPFRRSAQLDTDSEVELVVDEEMDQLFQEEIKKRWEERGVCDGESSSSSSSSLSSEEDSSSDHKQEQTEPGQVPRMDLDERIIPAQYMVGYQNGYADQEMNGASDHTVVIKREYDEVAEQENGDNKEVPDWQPEEDEQEQGQEENNDEKQDEEQDEDYEDYPGYWVGADPDDDLDDLE